MDLLNQPCCVIDPPPEGGDVKPSDAEKLSFQPSGVVAIYCRQFGADEVLPLLSGEHRQSRRWGDVGRTKRLVADDPLKCFACYSARSISERVHVASRARLTRRGVSAAVGARFRQCIQ